MAKMNIKHRSAVAKLNMKVVVIMFILTPLGSRRRPPARLVFRFQIIWRKTFVLPIRPRVMIMANTAVITCVQLSLVSSIMASTSGSTLLRQQQQQSAMHTH
uniref:Uncharacterized protein n=1 Tax=Romanomermis culicivorax TaxID=13658 RepID=A0A915IX70_ROMCU